MDDKVELGDKVKDTITGYTGIAVGIAEWLYGCRRVSVIPDKLIDGKPGETLAFDEPSLKIIKKGAVKDTPKQSEAGPGGPRNDPPRHSHQATRR